MSEYEISKLKNEVWTSARDGQSNRLKALLENVRKEIACEILNHYTNEDGQSTTPLIIAVIKGNENIVDTLNDFCVDLELKGTVIYKKDTIHGATALWCASCWGHYDIVRILVDNGADVDNPTETGSSPLRPASYDDRYEIVQYLVEHGADVNTTNAYKSTCLMNTCYTGNNDIAKYLLMKGIDPKLKDAYGITALHYSAAQGHLALSTLLVNKGVPIMNKDHFGVTPLMKAAVNGHKQVIDHLSALAGCSKEDRIDVWELLGTFYLFQEHSDLSEAHRHLMMAMQERYKDQHEITPKRIPPISSIHAITGKKECGTLSEVTDLRDDKLSLCIEAMHIYERVLGTENHHVIFPLFYAGSLFANNGDYNKCIDLWQFASKVCQNTDKGCTSIVYKFPNIFAKMLHEGIQIDFSSLLKSFQSAETELRLDKDRLQINEEKFRRYYEEDIIACTYLIGIMILSYTSKEEECQLKRAVYSFIHQKPRLWKGVTPLHMCCDSGLNDSKIDVSGEILFPNVLICKAFVACGADVNAQDNNRNTPLHIIAKCFGAKMSVLSEIIECLIDNGAHVDACNIDGKTVVDVAPTDIAESIIKTHEKLSLKCLCARTVKKHKIEYQGIIPDVLCGFIELH